MLQDFYRNILDQLFEGVYCLDTNRQITYWNKGAELLTGYRADEVVGKHCSDNILIHVDAQGNLLCPAATCPASKCMGCGGFHEAEIFLHHKDGHRVPITTRVNAMRDDSGKIVGTVEIFSERYAKLALEQQLAELEKLSLLDTLTEVGNRRFGERQLQERLNEFQRSKVQFGVLLLDLDHFKAVNDSYGHDVGDRVLKMVAKTLAINVRLFDHVSRWGGEEFLVIVSNVDLPRLCAIAEKLRLMVKFSLLTDHQPAVGTTVSIGATIARRDDTVESIVARADKLLYQSKTEGRNRVTSVLPA